jgi:hypothetical protein
MTSEGFKSSPTSHVVEQGDAGFLTEAQLNEMNAPEASSVEAPVEAPAALSPERRAEVMEQIGHQEDRTKSLVAENRGLLATAETKMAAVEANKSEAPTKPALTYARIQEAYDKGINRMERVKEVGLLGSLSTMTAGMYVGIYGLEMNHHVGNQSVIDAGLHVMEGGAALGWASAAVLGIGYSLNWMNKKFSERNRESAINARYA